MPDAVLTLHTLFEADDRFYSQLVTAGEQELGETKDHTARLMRALRWTAIAKAIRAKAPELLQVDVMDLVTGAWEKYRVLSDLAEQSRSAKETDFYPLEDHAIHTEMQPYLEIQVGTLATRITLDVNADLELKGLILKIESGRITAIESGSCEGSGEIKYKHLTLLKPQFKPLELPGRVNLGAGIPLAREADPR